MGCAKCPCSSTTDYSSGTAERRTSSRLRVANNCGFALNACHWTICLANVLEGEVEVTISGTPMRVTAGEMVIMPANQPRALKAISRFKMMLR